MATLKDPRNDGQPRKDYLVAPGWTVVDSFERMTEAGKVASLTEAEARAQHYKLDPDPYAHEVKAARDADEAKAQANLRSQGKGK